MLSSVRNFLHKINHKPPEPAAQGGYVEPEPNPLSRPVEIDIAPDDPILTFFSSAPGVVEIDKLQMDSPALALMKASGVQLAVPLVSQGELIGLLNLGPRRSEQEYSTDDRRLLSQLATQAAPALRVAQLARQQQIEARERERLEQELRVARVIQETLLPKEIPSISGYELAAHWQPARAVSGDFYDFLIFPDGRLGIIEADVTDKGVPAALVMATTRTLLREAAEHLVSPGKVLERANELLVPDIPHNMFVTCLYMLIEPHSGLCVIANAGHNLPIKCGLGQVEEIRVRGMPLGLIPGLTYEEKQVELKPGESFMLYSDGLVEAHNPQGVMFESPRLLELLKSYSGGPAQIQACLRELEIFTGLEWEQEDDVTLVTIDRYPTDEEMINIDDPEQGIQVLGEFEIESAPGNEREAMELVADMVGPLGFSKERLERLRTAVAETAMNAMEHGNKYQVELKVLVRVYRVGDDLVVRIRDHGGGKKIPEHVLPDLESKLAGLQTPRGWGLFLIENMVDEMHVYTDESHHTVELKMKLKE